MVPTGGIYRVFGDDRAEDNRQERRPGSSQPSREQNGAHEKCEREPCTNYGIQKHTQESGCSHNQTGQKITSGFAGQTLEVRLGGHEPPRSLLHLRCESGPILRPALLTS
jgi:hypothetical protein